MTRTIFFIATAVVAASAGMAPAANACISCEHVPVVIRGSQTNHVTPRYYVEKRPRARVRIGASKRDRTIAAARAAAKRRAIASAKSKAKAKALAAHRTNVRKKAIAAAQRTAVEAPPLPVRAMIERADVTIGEPKVVLAEISSDPVDCKKFVPSAGLTITVPCE